MERNDRGHDGVETRVFPVTEARVKRAEDGSPQEIVTDVAVFDSLSENLGGFVERVDPGALQPADDVTSEFNHDPNQIIGRKSAGNLEIEETDESLKFRVSPVPETDDARNLVEKIDMGLVQGGSFTFRVHDETWEEREDEPDVRTIHEATFFEGGPVTHPAYPATATELRDTRVAERRHQRFRETLEERDGEEDGETGADEARKRRERRLRLEEVAL